MAGSGSNGSRLAVVLSCSIWCCRQQCSAACIFLVGHSVLLCTAGSTTKLNLSRTFFFFTFLMCLRRVREGRGGGEGAGAGTEAVGDAGDPVLLCCTAAESTE